MRKCRLDNVCPLIFLTHPGAQPQDVMVLATSLVTTPHTEGMANQTPRAQTHIFFYTDTVYT